MVFRFIFAICTLLLSFHTFVLDFLALIYNFLIFVYVIRTDGETFDYIYVA